MPIESIIRLKSGMQTDNGYTRIVGVNARRYFVHELIEGQTNVVKFEISLRDWKDKEAAQPVWKDREVPDPNAIYDESNPVHFAQWDAYQKQPGGNPPEWFTDPFARDDNGNLHWQPTVTITQRYWDGTTIGEPIQDRSVSFEIPIDNEAQLLNTEFLTKLYTTAMQLPGAFENPKIPDPG